MKVYINDMKRNAFVVGKEVGMACHLGFYLALNHPDLTKLGWSVFGSTQPPTRWRDYRFAGIVLSAQQLATAIRKGPTCSHFCGHHEAVK